MASADDTNSERPKEVSQEPAWAEFTRLHPDHAAINDEAIYALPRTLIDELQALGAVERPTPFFDENEERFERDLRRFSEHGFFRQSPIFYDWLSESDRAMEVPSDVRMEQHREIMQARGRNPPQIKSYVDKVRKTEKLVRERSLGFVGWLATNPEFRNAVAVFRDQWQEPFAQVLGLPLLPWMWFDDASVQEEHRDFFEAYKQLYYSWNVDGLATWDLPIPIRHELTGPSLYNLSHVHQSGLVIFVPWHLLRDNKLTLADLARLKRDFHAPTHLNAWVERERDWGYKRYALMLKLYVYLELALQQRYPTKVQGHLDQLDHAFAAYFNPVLKGKDRSISYADSVRKLRQKMYRRLRVAE